jgi:methionine-rich copper-binding protein CopC
MALPGGVGMSAMRKHAAWLQTSVAIIFGLGLADWASAHATLVKSTPAADAVLTQQPSVTQAWYSEEVAVKGSFIHLYDSADKLLASGRVDLNDHNHESMKLIPPFLSPGTYTIKWHAISADDNHVTQDAFRFTVQSAASAPSRPTADNAATRGPY